MKGAAVPAICRLALPLTVPCLAPAAASPPTPQLAGAVLDVTDPEPLPEGHPLWRHPLVRIFPHRATCASEDVAESLAVTLDTR